MTNMLLGVLVFMLQTVLADVDLKRRVTRTKKDAQREVPSGILGVGIPTKSSVPYPLDLPVESFAELDDKENKEKTTNRTMKEAQEEDEEEDEARPRKFRKKKIFKKTITIPTVNDPCACIGNQGASDGSKYHIAIGNYCEAWDSIERHCTQVAEEHKEDGGSHDWCKHQWCYVDPCKCKRPVYKGTYWTEEELSRSGSPYVYYSYAPCEPKFKTNNYVPELTEKNERERQKDCKSNEAANRTIDRT